MCIKLVVPSSHLILCHPLLLLPPIPPSIRVFSNESTLHTRWPKYWSFSFSISPSNDHPGLISFRMEYHISDIFISSHKETWTLFTLTPEHREHIFFFSGPQRFLVCICHYFYLFIFLCGFLNYFFKFYFIFKLYKIVLVLPNIKMNPPQVYMCSPFWTLHRPPSPYHPSGLSQCTSPKHPVSCIEAGLASRFIHDILHVSMPFSQNFPPSPSPIESIRLFYTSVSLLLSRTQGYCYHLSKFHIYVLVYCIGVFPSGLLHSV